MTRAPLTLVKLGGSLITDKRRPGRARRQVIARLAGERVGDTLTRNIFIFVP